MTSAPDSRPLICPSTRRVPVVETLHGVEVADPYRWLEDADDPEVVAWASRQQQFTEATLEPLPERAWFAAALMAQISRPRAGVPVWRAGHYLLSRHDGVQAQPVWFYSDTLEGLLTGGDVLLDPNTWDRAGSISVSGLAVSPDGRRLAYARNDAGSDWQHIAIREIGGAEDRGEPITAKFTVPTWLPDSRSLLYSTFDQASDPRGTSTTGLGTARLMVRREDGTDEEFLSFPHEPQTMAHGWVSAAGTYLIVIISTGTARANRLWVYPLTTVEDRTTWGKPIKVVDVAQASYEPLRLDEERLVLRTDAEAPLGRVVAVDLGWAARGDIEFAEVVPETRATLTGAVAAGDGLLLEYLDDASSAVVYVGREGEGGVDVELPAGALVGLEGRPGRDEAFVALSTLTTPSTSYRLLLPTVADDPVVVERLALVPEDREPPEPAFTLQRHRARSADGTAVPYFLAVPLDDHVGPRPTLLYGYGGFMIPVLADYRPGWAAWLEAGGALAVANLRGGGEFGTSWYEQGRLAAKQNVFDDAIAVAEDLIVQGVTTPDHLAVHGRSNGGLLAGAVLTQRPDLFAAVLPSVGVLDLLRFHLFTIGAAWMSDYGDPDTAEGFRSAYAYSPLHRITPGEHYPATLISTADHDDRVVPLHSYKFAAALQAAQGGEAPVLLRVDQAAGHGAGKPSAQVAAEWTDLLAFAAAHTGLHPHG